MKSFIVSLVLSAIIISGSIIYTVYLNDLSERLCLYNAEIKQLLIADRYEDAKKEAEELSEFVEHKKLSLASTIEHSSIDNIEKNIAELIVFTDAMQSPDALAKCEVLKILFEHLPKNYSLTLENIL